MMKPGMGSYDRFKELFDTYSKQAGKEQYLIPYFISAHPGTRDEDMVNLALWLKKHRFRLDQVQNFYPSPLANSTTMYYTGKNPLAKIGYKSEDVFVPKGDKQRRLHKALLRYHDPANWPLIRQALEAMGKKHLIGSRRDCLVPAPTIEEMREARRQNLQYPSGVDETYADGDPASDACYGKKSVVYAISSGECWCEETA